jgi:hypothetical protein
MVFRSKIDSFYINFILIVVLIIGLATFFPIFLEGGREWPVILLLTSIFLIVIGFLLWTNFSVTYIFEQDYLFIKGGPFRYRIPYKNIIKISPTTAIFTGHRILSSRDAIEIFNNTTFMGSIKISPKDKSGFITELKKQCPSLQIQE